MSGWAFTLDLNRCTGCSACRLACTIENRLPPGRSWRTVHTFNDPGLPDLGVHHLSLACNHCAEAPCMRGCPTAAYSRHPFTGAVLLDPDRCIGCRYCAWVCPYAAPRFNPAEGAMEKCTFCCERLEQGEQPACVVSCPVEALGLMSAGELRGEPAAAGLPSTGISPSLHLVDRRAGLRAPEMSPEPPRLPLPTRGRAQSGWAGLRSEWSLLVFSLTAVALVAWFTAAEVGGPAVLPTAFVAAGLLAFTISLLHLGRPLNAWRAALNLHRSWVSREIVLFSLFFGLACCSSAFGIETQWVRWSTVMIGLGSLLSMDMVYRVRGQEVPALPHSAMASLTAVMMLGLLIGEPLLVGTVLALKAALFVIRRPSPAAAVMLRLVAGFALPVGLWLLGAPWTHPLALAGLVVAEVVDRALYYTELRFLDPILQIDRDLEALAGKADLGGSG